MLKLLKLFILVIFCFQASSLYADTLQPKSCFLNDRIELIRQYLSPNELTKKNKDEINTIIIFGSNDLNVVKYAYKQFKKIYNPHKFYTIIFTGGIAGDTQKLYKSKYIQQRVDNGLCQLRQLDIRKKLYQGDVKGFFTLTETGMVVGKIKVNREYLTEAEIFANMFLEIAMKDNLFLFSDYIHSYSHKTIFFCDIKQSMSCIFHVNIILETESISTSDNAFKIKAMLDKYNIDLASKVLLIQKPLVQRRAWLSALQFLGRIDENIFINSTYFKILSFEDIIIELDKIILFGRQGFCAQDIIPNKILQTKKMIEAI